ncbi:hypothetical protein MRX96_036187, partial [Rhipicephalus microplus]
RPTTRNRTYWFSRCSAKYYGGCIYPYDCFCPKPPPVAYMRLTLKDSPWYYNNKTKKCQQARGDPSGCNRFTSRIECLMSCKLPLKRRQIYVNGWRRYN